MPPPAAAGAGRGPAGARRRVPYLVASPSDRKGRQGRPGDVGTARSVCFILDDSRSAGPDETSVFRGHLPWFRAARRAGPSAGYFLLPGATMMATNIKVAPSPARPWRQYFRGSDPRSRPVISEELQMLASGQCSSPLALPIRRAPVCDWFAHLPGRPPGYDSAAQRDQLTKSFVAAHRVSNSDNYTGGRFRPVSGDLATSATFGSSYKNTTRPRKHSGVVPVVDLGRIYALTGQLTQANTRARILAATAARVVSPSGGRDLLDAYDMIADHPAGPHRRRRSSAARSRPTSCRPPTSAIFERSHLRDAFVVVKTMQNAARLGPRLPN